MEDDEEPQGSSINDTRDDNYEWDPLVFHHLIEPVYYLVHTVCPISIIGGVFSNILALVVVARSRLWSRHEGYVYLAASFGANVGSLLFVSSTPWLISISYRYYPPHNSDFICRIWSFLQSIVFASGWLSVGLLFNVYLREHLIHRRRCGCPIFAAKYCTLFATKIIVGVIFSVVVVVALPYLAAVQLVPSVGCMGTHMYEEVMLTEIALLWGLPTFIYLVLILTMLCTSREGSTFGFSQLEQRTDSDEQMRAMAAVLTSMIFLSQLVLFFPNHFFGYYSVTLNTVASVIYGLSIAIHPILCFVILKTIRDEFRSQLQNIRCCRRLFPSLDRDLDHVVQLSAIQEDPSITAES